MKLINDNDTLLKYVPNTFATAKGETSLYDKLLPWLEASEQWFSDNIAGEDTLAEIAQIKNILFSLSAQIVINDALINAIPSLDLVLTPNGFGVVSNNNVAPASKERVERLIASLEADRDKNIELLIPLLAQQTQWVGSEQHKWFAFTLFPNLDLTTLCDIKEHRWLKYCELRQKVVAIEQSLAEEYFSPELMTTLREVRGSFEPIPMRYAPLLAGIRSEIVAVIKGEPIYQRGMIDLVNYIRHNPDDFPEWVNSATAKLFSPPIFENDLMANGYWF